jgi:hypothetical protein
LAETSHVCRGEPSIRRKDAEELPQKTPSSPRELSAATKPNSLHEETEGHRKTFLACYHQRSNIESTFSAIKRRFGESVKAKNEMSGRCETKPWPNSSAGI